ncbi:MAG: AbrB family transcriptional regulator, partial [Deltaproteobacteria bacterium]
TVVALAAGILLVVGRALPWWSVVPMLALAAAGMRAAAGISLDPARRAGLRQSIEMTLGIHAAGSITLVAAVLLR